MFELSIPATWVGLAATVISVIGGVIIAKLNSIHTLANSNLTATNKRLDTALTRLEDLHVIIQAMSPPHRPRTTKGTPRKS